MPTAQTGQDERLTMTFFSSFGAGDARAMLADMIAHASLERLHAIAQLHEAGVSVTDAERALASKKAEILRTVDPKDLGSNAETRNANVIEMCAVQIASLEDARRTLDRARYEMECQDNTKRMLRELRIVLIGPDGEFNN